MATKAQNNKQVGFKLVQNKNGFDFYGIYFNGAFLEYLVRVPEGADTAAVASAFHRGELTDLNLQIV